MAEIRFDSVSCLYKGSTHPAVSELDLTVADGEFLVLVGPSGCGKTTSLRMLAGLEHPSEGKVLMDGQDVTRMSPSRRDVAMVFQSYALYPNMTVMQNIEFPLKVARVGKAERRDRARKVAAMLDLSDYLGRKPKALSGGQRQRVAMGRAIVRRPRAFLLDEPLSNLDAKLRVETRTQIAALQRELAVTTVYVTHDQVEAMTMGDRIAVMRDGELQQCGTPSRDLSAPRQHVRRRIHWLAADESPPRVGHSRWRRPGRPARAALPLVTDRAQRRPGGRRRSATGRVHAVGLRRHARARGRRRDPGRRSLCLRQYKARRRRSSTRASR